MNDALDYYTHDHAAPQIPGAPTLVMLHGTGGDRTSFGRLAETLAPGAGVLSLDGDVSEFGHRRFFRRRAEGVYDMADLAERTGRLSRFLGAAVDAYGLDPASAIGVGYSNGANILANLALTGQGALRRHVLMHPLIPFHPEPGPALDGAQILITAGRRDPICPPEQTRRLADELSRRGAEVRLAWFDGGHEVSPSEVSEIAQFAAARPSTVAS